MMKLQQFTVLVSLLVAGPLPIYGQCSSGDKVEEQTTSCLSQFNTVVDFLKGTVKVSQLNTYCKSSAPNTEIKCVENIINACKQSDEDAYIGLEKAINIKAIKSSVEMLCNKKQVLMEKQDCLGQYSPTVTTCIGKENLSFSAKLQSLRTQAVSKGDKWFEDKAYEASCKHFEEVSDCQRPYGQNCGSEIGDVFDGLIQAVTPPACAGVAEHVNFILLLSLVFVALVKGQL